MAEFIQTLFGNGQHGFGQVKAGDGNVFFSAGQFFEYQAGAATDFKYLVKVAVGKQFINYFLIVVIAGCHDKVIITRHIRVIAHCFPRIEYILRVTGHSKN